MGYIIDSFHSNGINNYQKITQTSDVIVLK